MFATECVFSVHEVSPEKGGGGFFKEKVPLTRIYHARLVVVTNTGNNNYGVVSTTTSVDLAGQKTAGRTLFVAWAKTIPDSSCCLSIITALLRLAGLQSERPRSCQP